VVSGDASQVLAGGWVGCNGPPLADLERKSMPLLWPFIAVAGASPSRISQCPRNELVGSTDKSIAERKDGNTDERAIFHQMPRVWTTYGGETQSRWMLARLSGLILLVGWKGCSRQ
jgi:hypothetical protein